jgi:DNA polymerase-1
VFALCDDRLLTETVVMRLLYKAKMLQHPDDITVFRLPDQVLPIHGSVRTDDIIWELRTSNCDLADCFVVSLDPAILCLDEWTNLPTYRPSRDNLYLELEEVTNNKLKKELGYDARDAGYFRELGLRNPERNDKTRAGKEREERFGWVNQPRESLPQLPSITDNIHITVGRSGFQNYEVVQDVSSVLRLLDQVERVGWDTETTGLNRRTDRIVGESLSIDGQRGYYLPMLHKGESQYDNLSVDEVERRLHPALSTKRIAGANLPFDVLMAARHGLGFPRNLEDIQGYAYMLGYHVPDPSKLGLKSLTREVLGEVMEEFDAVAKGGTFDNVPIHRAAPYAADDAAKSLRLADTLRNRLSDSQRNRFDTIEVPFLYTVIRMTYNGVYLDQEALPPLMEEFERELQYLRNDIQGLARVEFSVDSPKQLQHILFEVLGLPPTRRTKTGYSTDKAALQKIEDLHPIIPLILDYRELTKLLTTYLSPLPGWVQDNGRLHSSLNPYRVITGRLASTDPNLLNIPIRTERGRRIRRLIAAQFERQLLSVDAAQLEYRVLADRSGNPRLIQAFNDASRDIHMEMASLIFGIPVEDVTPEQRSQSKNVVYAIIYGASPRKIASMLNSSINYAEGVLNRILTNIPEIPALRNRVLSEARENGYVESVLGHRSYINGIQSLRRDDREAAERTAFDALFQGTGSGDITKLATINAQRYLDELYPDFFNPEVMMILQVHDELLFEGPEQSLIEFAPLACKAFEESVELSVPIVADFHHGKNWGEIH